MRPSAAPTPSQREGKSSLRGSLSTGLENGTSLRWKALEEEELIHVDTIENTARERVGRESRIAPQPQDSRYVELD